MLANYLKLALRNLRFKKGQSYVFINILGLAAAIGVALLLFAVVRFESNYDSFHKRGKDIYRIVTKDAFSGGEAFKSGVPYQLADYVKLNLPQVKRLTSIDAVYGSQIIVPAGAGVGTSDGKYKEDEGVFFTGPEYFDIFDAVWLSGNSAALAEPNTVVLNKTVAAKYFGQWQNAIGRYIRMDQTLMLQVAGVIEDFPANSDFPMRLIVSYGTLKNNAGKYGYDQNLDYINSSHQLFMLMPGNTNEEQINAQLTELSNKMYANKGGIGKFHFLLPLKENHFDSRFSNFGDHTASRSTLRILALIGQLIIIMASINFINIATARASHRAKEIGIRKVLGSDRRQLIIQLLLETGAIVLFSTLLGALIAGLLLPHLNNMINIHAHLMLLDKSNLLVLVLIFISVTLLAGMYPAFVLSGLKPIAALKRHVKGKAGGGIQLRKVLVVVQFSILQMLMIATIVIMTQMNFIRYADLGYDKSGVFMVPCYADSTNAYRLQSLKNQLLEVPGVQAVSFATDPPSSDNNWSSNFYFDHSKKNVGFNVFLKFSDADYFRTFDLKVLAGKAFSAGDTTREFVVNETFVRKLELKNNEDIIGKTIRIGTGNWYPIVGVVKDFKTNSLREDIKPMAIAINRSAYSQINIKMAATTHLQEPITHISNIWQSFFPDYAFTGEFLDESIARFYRQETQLAALYKSFSVIALLISCLGLYSLIAFMTLHRKKEIAVRKVLGASIGGILQLFLKELSLLIGISFLIAIPVGYWGISKWLQNFPYHINISILQFVTVFFMTLLIALLTSGYKVLKAALANPKESLQGE
ncbi:FtsX-like permease family protein [Chitinophaga varians]|uniref:FtsX-like permease family protein n=1 Tax=Chitinophaga varians TaxID=2202339 RepID=A0A847S2M8_9BACT|nr:ABC transporter permease [Chitinophaga varians]NLR68664.1 FtsX-like permease family protein [Chitinophaga varians]